MFNINVNEKLVQELAKINPVIIHSDLLLSQSDSKTKYDVTELLNAFPSDLQEIAKYGFGFHIVSETHLYDYLLNHVLVHSGFIEETYDQCQQFFLSELIHSYNKHFPNVFNKRYRLMDKSVIEKIASFATNQLLESCNIKINNVKVIIDLDLETEHSTHLHNVNWVDRYVANI